MIRPILRKDLELHWKAAIGLQILYVAANIFAIRDSGQQAVDVLSIPLYATGFYLLTALVQSDPIPCDRSDWLIRPIRRRDLLFAKLLFVALVFLLPVITFDTIVPFSMGFGMERVPGAAVGHAISILFGLILPTLAIAAATRNIAQAALGGIFAAFAYSMLMPFLPWSVERDFEILRWVEDVAVLAIAAIVSTGVLCLQYFGRRTRWSYAAALAGFGAIAALAHAPLQAAWSIQAQLRPAAGFEEGIKIKPFERESFLKAGAPLIVNVPLEVTGRNPDYPLIPQKTVMRIRFSNGEVREAESSDLRPVNFVNGIHRVAFDFGVDAALLDLRDLMAEPEISLSFFAFKPLQSREFHSASTELVPDAGRCRVVEGKEAMIGECLQVGDDSPIPNLGAGWSYDSWVNFPLDRLSPVFVRFRPTVFNWNSNLVARKKVEMDLREGKKNFTAFDATVRIQTGAFEGIVTREIPLQSTRFSQWRFSKY